MTPQTPAPKALAPKALAPPRRALGLAALALLGSTAIAQAFEDGVITIWMSQDRSAEQLAAVAARFTEDLGIEVRIESPEPIPDKFPQAAATGDGPDVVLWAHDRFGEWAASGLLSPVDLPAGMQADLAPVALEALTFDGATWGYPIALESAALIYNREYVTEPPETFEEIADLELPEGVRPILWAYSDTYYSMALLAANGGYAFEKVDGRYDGTSTGVNNEGAVAGAELLRAMVEDGVMPRGVDYGIVDTAMNKGEVAMMISGPWAWSNLERSGIDYGVAPLPSVAGQPARPFVGVYAAGVNAASPNKDLVKELFENYLLTDEGLAAWNETEALGTVADLSVAATQTSDPRLAAALEAARGGVPMPSNPEMGRFWSAMEPALAAITNGQQTPQEALDGAAQRILAN